MWHGLSRANLPLDGLAQNFSASPRRSVRCYEGTGVHPPCIQWSARFGESLLEVIQRRLAKHSTIHQNRQLPCQEYQREEWVDHYSFPNISHLGVATWHFRKTESKAAFIIFFAYWIQCMWRPKPVADRMKKQALSPTDRQSLGKWESCVSKIKETVFSSEKGFYHDATEIISQSFWDRNDALKA